MINTVWLRTFCTLVEVSHFTRTAQRLNMTQSGVSQHIHKLEEQLGIELLVREGKQFSLSDAGERLYSEAQKVLTALSSLENKISDDLADEGLVRVISPGSVGLRLYPHLLTLQSQHCRLVFDYRFAPNSDVENAIAESRADIGFMTSQSALPEVKCTPVTEEPLILVTPATVEYPNWKTLIDLGFIDHPDGSHHANLLLEANYREFKHYEQFPQKGFSNQIGLILEPVSRGFGFTVLPAYAVEAFDKQELIKIHSLPNPVSETLYMCLRRNRVLPKRIEMVLSEAKRRL